MREEMEKLEEVREAAWEIQKKASTDKEAGAAQVVLKVAENAKTFEEWVAWTVSEAPDNPWVWNAVLGVKAQVRRVLMALGEAVDNGEGVEDRQWRFNYNLIPRHTLTALRHYEQDRRPPGDFLTAVLENDLLRAVAHADEMNMRAIIQLTLYIHNNLRVPRGYKGCVRDHCGKAGSA